MLLTETREAASAEFASIDLDRIAEVERRQTRVAELLERLELDALLLQRPENVAWFTAGGDFTRFGGATATAALLLTPDARVVVTNNVDSPQIFEHELPGLGFQLKERPWHEDARILVEDVCRGREVGSDSPHERTKLVADEIAELRLPLTSFDLGRLRKLGRIVAHAAEATCRQMEPGRTEIEIAAELAHRALKYRAVPERLQVVGDGRGERHRHWSPREFPVESTCTVSLVARRWGLHVGAARTVSFDKPSDEFVRAHHVTMIALTTGMHFARAGRRMVDVWPKVERMYDKFREPDAWHNADQATLVGYAPHERTFVPDGEHVLRPGEPIHWHPAVGPAFGGDTMLVLEGGGELLTPTTEWPRLTIEIKGHETFQPAILRRE